MTTPGPWTVQYHDGLADVLADHPTKTLIRDLEPDDARLIAAAPDLLAALERFVEMESGRPVSMTGNNVEAFREVFENARAAIAKGKPKHPYEREDF